MDLLRKITYEPTGAYAHLYNKNEVDLFDKSYEAFIRFNKRKSNIPADAFIRDWDRFISGDKSIEDLINVEENLRKSIQSNEITDRYELGEIQRRINNINDEIKRNAEALRVQRGQFAFNRGGPKAQSLERSIKALEVYREKLEEERKMLMNYIHQSDKTTLEDYENPESLRSKTRPVAVNQRLTTSSNKLRERLENDMKLQAELKRLDNILRRYTTESEGTYDPEKKITLKDKIYITSMKIEDVKQELAKSTEASGFKKKTHTNKRGKNKITYSI